MHARLSESNFRALCQCKNALTCPRPSCYLLAEKKKSFALTLSRPTFPMHFWQNYLLIISVAGIHGRRTYYDLDFTSSKAGNHHTTLSKASIAHESLYGIFHHGQKWGKPYFCTITQSRSASVLTVSLIINRKEKQWLFNMLDYKALIT